MSYAFWNDFVAEWIGTPEAVAPLIPEAPIDIINHWSNPNLIPLFNSGHEGASSLHYIPEPWWGNSNQGELHCVFLNHNPHSGGDIQTQPAIAEMIGPANIYQTYQDLVGHEVMNFEAHLPTNFQRTCEWHQNQRSRQIFSAVNAINGHTINVNSISPLLSVELIPWHTKKFDTNELNYLLLNANSFVMNSLLFAATESRRIINEILVNKPLIRTNRRRIEQLLNHLQAEGHIGGFHLADSQMVNNHNPHYSYEWDWFTIDRLGFEGITFFRIQAYGNRLPGYEGTEDFLTRVNAVI